ncbi:MAG: ExbD/TolR family protein [Planctomycetota bacterium]
MAKKSRVAQDPEPKIDMTPMIDIVFNLIIFFMIVSELSNMTLEQLQLAYASEAQDPKKIASGVDKVLQINVLPSGLVKIRGAGYSDDPKLKGQYPSIKEFLETEAAGYEREEPDPSNPNLAPSKMRVNIRADKETMFKNVQQVFDACSKNGVYKTSLAATKDAPTK